VKVNAGAAHQSSPITMVQYSIESVESLCALRYARVNGSRTTEFSCTAAMSPSCTSMVFRASMRAAFAKTDNSMGIAA
jgi:hypothetical protein